MIFPDNVLSFTRELISCEAHWRFLFLVSFSLLQATNLDILFYVDIMDCDYSVRVMIDN